MTARNVVKVPARKQSSPAVARVSLSVLLQEYAILTASFDRLDGKELVGCEDRKKHEIDDRREVIRRMASFEQPQSPTEAAFLLSIVSADTDTLAACDWREDEEKARAELERRVQRCVFGIGHWLRSVGGTLPAIVYNYDMGEHCNPRVSLEAARTQA